MTLFGHGHGAALVNFLLFVETVKRGKTSARGDIKKTGVIKLILCNIKLSNFAHFLTEPFTPLKEISKVIILSNRWRKSNV